MKRRQLLDFVEKYKDLPAQGSVQWLKDRKFTIGGSEMSTITGDNHYSDIKTLVKRHVGLETFNGNINTHWGSILEDLVVKVLERSWKSKIYELGSLPGAVDGQKYSPDGLVYLSFLDKIILLEIKNAARRIATGSVPKMYLPQILTGLESIPIADYALFVDVMFRRCSASDFGFNPRYDHVIHPAKKTQNPIMLAAVAVYGEGKTEVVIDLGKCNSDILEPILRKAKSGNYFFSEQQTYQACLNECKQKCEQNNTRLIGIMPLKVFKFHITKVDRQLKYVDRYAQKIKETISIIRRIDASDDKEQAFQEEYSTMTQSEMADFYTMTR